MKKLVKKILWKSNYKLINFKIKLISKMKGCRKIYYKFKIYKIKINKKLIYKQTLLIKQIKNCKKFTIKLINRIKNQQNFIKIWKNHFNYYGMNKWKIKKQKVNNNRNKYKHFSLNLKIRLTI